MRDALGSQELSGTGHRRVVDGSVSRDTTKRTIGPGSTTTARVVVQELAGVAQDVVVFTRLPAGWRLLSEPITTHVPAKSRAFRLVQFQVPADAEAGEYSVIQAVRAPGLDTDLESHTTVIVTVRRSVAVMVVDEPTFAASGSKIHMTFLVANRGNARTKIRLRVRTEPGVSATADTLSELKAGESRTVASRSTPDRHPMAKSSCVMSLSLLKRRGAARWMTVRQRRPRRPGCASSNEARAPTRRGLRSQQISA